MPAFLSLHLIIEMNIDTICICGAGTMGTGIAQATAQSGFYTLLYEVNETVLENARRNIETSLNKLVEKQKITVRDQENALQRIQYIGDVQNCLADVFIEAIIEKKELKIALFNQLAELNHGESIFATNTSSLSVSAIAEAVVNPQRLVGMHFFNPATIMKLVEVVKGEQTNDHTLETIVELAKQMGKTPVISADRPGFIVNRVARPYYIESLRLVEEGQVDFGQADKLLENAGFRMGPFKLMDLIGNDVNFAVSCSVFDQLGSPERLKPSTIQEEKVKQGKLGKKSGEGYYSYN